MGNVADVAGTAIMFSDPSLKKNILLTGEKTKDGIPVITWQWNDKGKALLTKYGHSIAKLCMGVNARDVQRIRPDLIAHIDGYLAVNYGGL
jgi:hypothetical protein